MIIFIDNGHGKNTPGKCAPDKSFTEWSFNRELADLIFLRLEYEGYLPRLVCPEDTDISLTERCRRVNNWLRGDDGILVSIHVNAAGSDGKWHDATGWGAYVSLNASDKSKKLATMLSDEMKVNGIKVRNYPFHTQNLAMCRDTKCPAVLTENLFMDSRTDLHMLKDKEFINKLAELHVSAIKKYLKIYGSL